MDTNAMVVIVVGIIAVAWAAALFMLPFYVEKIKYRVNAMDRKLDETNRLLEGILRVVKP